MQQHLPGVGGQVQPQIFQCLFGGVLACQRAESSAQVFGVVDDGGMGWVGEQFTEPSVGAGLVALHVDWAHAELAGGDGDGLWVQRPSARREHFVVVVGESIEQSAGRCRGVHALVGRVERARVTASRAAITMARTVPIPPLGRLTNDEMVSPARSDQVANCAP